MLVCVLCQRSDFYVIFTIQTNNDIALRSGRMGCLVLCLSCNDNSFFFCSSIKRESDLFSFKSIFMMMFL